MSSDPEPGHASSEDLAAYLSRSLSTDERAEVERHLAICESCRDELAAAQDLLARRRRPMQMGTALVVAAAAVAVLLVIRLPQSQQSLANVPVSRGTATAAASISVIEPKDDAITGDSGVVFRWSPATGTISYRITLMSEGGDSIWSDETTATTIALPSTVHLAPGTSYVWYVDSAPASGDSLSSGPVGFRTR